MKKWAKVLAKAWFMKLLILNSTPVYGPIQDYSNYKPEDTRKTIVINPGHGENDPGYISKSKDVIELKRAVSKIKKTVEALEGKIAGFGENTIIATPSKVFDIQKGAIEQREMPSKDEIERF